MSADKRLVQESALYEAKKEEWEKEHFMEWVVIHGTELVGFYEDFQLAATTAIQLYGRGPYLIQRIGEPKRPLPISLFMGTKYAAH